MSGDTEGSDAKDGTMSDDGHTRSNDEEGSDTSSNGIRTGGRSGNGTTTETRTARITRLTKGRIDTNTVRGGATT